MSIISIMFVLHFCWVFYLKDLITSYQKKL